MEDEPFLRAMLANPDDRVSRLVYADWLDDRADPRGEYARLAALVAELPHDHRRPPRYRMLELQPQLPQWWVAIVGGLRATPEDDRIIGPRIEEVGRAIGCAAKRTDAEGYELEIEDGATNGMSGAIAYLESRSQRRGAFHDIHFYLYLRHPERHVVVWEPHTYNPYFGCDTKFLEWYGDVVVFIYREKHSTYVARFGFDAPARFHKIEDHWVLDGREIGFIGYQETQLRRLSVPELEVLPPLTESEAVRRNLMPVTPTSWRDE